MTIQKTNIVNQSQMILARLGRVAVPRELDKLVKQLRAEHEALTAVRAATLPAREALRLARLRVHEAEEAADAAVAELANALVLTSIGDRFSPLAVVGAPTPTRIAGIKGLRKRDAVRDVVTRVATLGRVPPSVKKAASSCDAAATELDLAVEERDHTEGVLARAVVTRNETQAVFVESLRKLELRARVAWEDAPEIAEAVFAPVRRVHRKRVTKDEPVTPAPDAEVPVVPLPALAHPIHVVPTGNPPERRLGPAIRGPFVFCCEPAGRLGGVRDSTHVRRHGLIRGGPGHAGGARRSHGHRPCRPRACIAVGPARRPAGSGPPPPMRLLPFVVPDELVHGAPLSLWKALFDVAWPGCNARLRSHDDVLRALASPVSTTIRSWSPRRPRAWSWTPAASAYGSTACSSLG